jgi:hypothetical protein
MPLIPFRVLLPLAGALALCLAGGCGQQPAAPVAVAGRVVASDGKPFPRLVLSFHPQDESNRRNMPSAVPNPADGKFSLTCLPGRYKVTLVIERGPAGGVSEPSSKGGLVQPGAAPPQQYLRYQTVADTPWSIDVPASGMDDLVLTLGPSVVTPPR